MKALYCTVLCYLARDGSSKVVNTKTDVGRVDKSSGGGGDGVGVSSIGGSIRVSSISSVQESGISLSISITLAVVDKSVPSSTRDRDVSSVHTGGTLETNTIGKGNSSITSIASVQQRWRPRGRMLQPKIS